jgi:hypothetical protein
MKMRPRLFGIFIRIVLAVIIFLVPITVSLPNNWFGSQPLIIRYIILVLGMLAVMGLTIYTEIEARRELEKKLQQKESELDQRNQQVAEYGIRAQLNLLLDEMKIPPKARIAIYLKNPSTGNLKIFYQYGMENSPDFDLEYEAGRGWAGYVWNTGHQVWWDLDRHGKAETIERWKFTEGEYRAIRATGIQSILYTSIVELKDPDNIIAVLGLDSTATFLKTHFNERATQDDVTQRTFIIGRLIVNGKIV